ncbi:MAG: succinate--CoA ligase subunit alpha [Thaumarchaeota archaeon]|nr:succinate--CoA ligase subunit alpha [Nitrososphaerota archaeon]
MTESTSVIVRGITGRYGSLHTKLMLQYGTRIAAGVTPGKGGQSVEGVPVYDTIKEAVSKTGSTTSILFVPAPSLYQAVEEDIMAGVRFLVAITEHVPIRDTLKVLSLATKHGAHVVGPNTPGVILPSRKVKLGIMPGTSFRPGSLALFSRSGTLMYEVANQLSVSGYGQAIALGIGGDPVNCTTMIECFDWASERDDVDGVVMVGEIGGDVEEMLAKHITQSGFGKKVFAYIAGRAAPKEKKMGHAGAIIYGNFGTAESKISALKAAGVHVAMTPAEIPRLVEKSIKKS